MDSYLRTTGLCRYYSRGGHTVKALDDASIAVGRGEFLSVVGSSGSGKTTLLNLLAGLDTPTAGRVDFGGVSLSGMSRKQLAAYRASKVGMIFQAFNLIGHYTALQNVETALYFTEPSPAVRQRRAQEILERVGLADRLPHRPADLSGGEQQRVAVARAIVKRPEVLFADEPTGNLDQENAAGIIALLTGLHREGLTIVMVTHNMELAEEQTDRVIRMQYGRVAAEGIPSAGNEGRRP